MSNTPFFPQINSVCPLAQFFILPATIILYESYLETPLGSILNPLENSKLLLRLTLHILLPSDGFSCSDGLD